VANEARQVLQQHDPQLVIGFGGGSVIDTAKAAGFSGKTRP